MHELTHALVFTPELLSYFPTDRRDPGPGAYEADFFGTGIAYLPDKATGKLRAQISTPRVVRAARQHYGCESVTGALLEDGGGAGTARSHWEMRTLRDEYMVGVSSPDRITSLIRSECAPHQLIASLIRSELRHQVDEPFRPSARPSLQIAAGTR